MTYYSKNIDPNFVMVVYFHCIDRYSYLLNFILTFFEILLKLVLNPWPEFEKEKIVGARMAGASVTKTVLRELRNSRSKETLQQPE